MRDVPGVYDVSRAAASGRLPVDRARAPDPARALGRRRATVAGRRPARGCGAGSGGPCRSTSPQAPACRRSGACSPRPSPSASSPRAPRAAVPLGIGDRLFPHLGNPGYDVASYDIAFTYPGQHQPLDAVTTIDARTTAATRPDQPRLRPRHGRGRSRSTARPPTFASAGEDLVVDARGAAARRELPTAHHRRGTPATPVGARPGRRLGADRGRARDGQPGRRRAPGLPVQRPPLRQGDVHLPGHRARTSYTAVANGLPEPARDRAGAATTWTYRTAAPHGHRTGAGLHRPLRRAAPRRTARAAGARRGARRGPRDAGTVAEEDARGRSSGWRARSAATRSRRTGC